MQRQRCNMVSFVMLLAATSKINYPKTESSSPAVSHYRNEREVAVGLTLAYYSNHLTSYKHCYKHDIENINIVQTL